MHVCMENRWEVQYIAAFESRGGIRSFASNDWWTYANKLDYQLFISVCDRETRAHEQQNLIPISRLEINFFALKLSSRVCWRSCSQ